MSNTFGRPGQDLPAPNPPGRGDNNDVVGLPDGGDGMGNDLPKPVATNSDNEPDLTSIGPSVPGVIERTN